MRLAYWSSVWFEGEFAPPSGAVRRLRLPKPRDAALQFPGFFDIERPLLGRRIALALYQADGTLFFQAGVRRWALSEPGLRFEFEVLPSRVFARFRVFEEKRMTWQITYAHLVRTLYALIHPTYDALEFENDHFLSFVASTALNSEWQANAQAHWLASQSAL